MSRVRREDHTDGKRIVNRAVARDAKAASRLRVATGGGGRSGGGEGKGVRGISSENPYAGRERPMNLVSGSDLQPYENGDDAILLVPPGAKGGGETINLALILGTLWALYADLSRSTDFRGRLGAITALR